MNPAAASPERESETHRLVLPAHLNHYGFLFGGILLEWVDEACWIAASLHFPRCRFVTIALDDVEFRHSVREGTILSIRCRCKRVGTTSVTYTVTVSDVHQPAIPAIFATHVTLVNVNADGTKTPIENRGSVRNDPPGQAGS